MMHYPIDRVLEALRGLGIEPRQSGSGYSCRCCAHEDRSPSLSINVGDDGRVLLTCHAGCSLSAILESLRLEPKDLFPEGPSASSPRRSSARPTGKPKQSFPSAEAAEAQVVRRVGRQPTARWEYFDAAGDLVGLVIRFDGLDGKTFRPVSRTTGGSWLIEGMPAPRPLYKLPEVLAA
ncbi:MAG: primase, partial [Planctomycetota bacterium]